MAKKFFIGLILPFFLLLALAGGVFVYGQNRKPSPAKVTPPAEDQQITLLEGWSLKDIASYVDKKGIMGKDEFLALAATYDTSDYETVKLKPKKASLEGYIFPDTYRIPKLDGNVATSSKAMAESLLSKGLSNFEKKFTEQMASRARELGMTPHEIVTLASIIEKETGRNATTEQQKQALDEERATVAGIFYNRLKIGMALESDATVNYVTGKNTPSASLSDTQVNSPYNTYRNRGLPPGPIANPSLSSLKAALYPNSTDYYYFLHKQPSGEVVYSRTFEEHVANKNRYLK